MDAVITYVDGADPQWQREYAAAVGVPPEDKRYREWGLLKYLLRGLEINLPFVEKLFLLVSGPSQLPSWLSSEVRVVCHKDIIPERYLPVFNSCAIEMFLHRIPGLGEQFVYFNDDLLPLLPCTKEDFFDDGRPALSFRKGFLATNMYLHQVKNSSDLARKALGLRPSPMFVRPPHSCMPMLRSHSEAAFAAVEEELLSRLSTLRTPRSVNQYFFTDYLYFAGRTVRGRISRKHISLGVYSGGKIADLIDRPSRQIACINDVSMPESRYLQTRKCIIDALERRFPSPSRFERRSSTEMSECGV